MQLVPGSLRRPAMVVLAACVSAIVVTGVRVAGYGLPGWLDEAFGPRIETHLGRFPAVINWLPDVGTLEPVAAMTLALVLWCAVTRRWRGAALAFAAVPIAIGLTEYVLKPAISGQGFPSGHATSMFALAAIGGVLLANPSLRRVPGAVRLVLLLLAVLMATAVAAAMVANGAHTFSDAVGGAAVGVGVVLACALTLDALGSLLRPGPAAPPPAAG
jgi:membrane-associated phospholipid phosphatase